MQSTLPPFTELVPAYGRDYRSAAAAKADFLAGKDFAIAAISSCPGYCSRRDFATGTPALIRYARQTKVCAVKA